MDSVLLMRRVVEERPDDYLARLALADALEEDGAEDEAVRVRHNAGQQRTALLAAWRFFREHAGYRIGWNALDAWHLARCEQAADEAGLLFEWEHDSDPQPWDEEDEPEEVLVCLCYGPDEEDEDGEVRPGQVLAALSGIDDPSREYRRVIEAELAAEALMELTTRKAGDQ